MQNYTPERLIMRRILISTCIFLITAAVMPAHADVVLTFDQNSIGDGVAAEQNYGDRVTAVSDASGAYDIVTGAGLGFTPNVEVSYTAQDPSLWTTGYGDLVNVFYDEVDFSSEFEISFIADSGFEVGIFDFDLAAFGGVDTTLPGIEIIDGDSNVLWSTGSTLISSSSRTGFDAGGVFANSLTISVDLSGLGGASDNIGIDNIRFGQQAIPEPSGVGILLIGLIGFLGRRTRVA